jgi:type IV secretory pathway TrbL component
MRQPLDVGGLVDRSLRDLGQILVVMGALLGAVLGVGLALIVENADTSGTVVASGPERAAVLASPPSSRPPASRVASSEGSAAGSGAAARQREAADQADHRDQKADRNRNGRPDKPGKRNVTPGKDKGR